MFNPGEAVETAKFANDALKNAQIMGCKMGEGTCRAAATKIEPALAELGTRLTQR